MQQAMKKGVIGGIIGATFGAFCWVLILGIVIKEPLLIYLPIISGLICVFGFVKLWDSFPQRIFSIVGIVILWLTILDMIFANIYYSRIPERLYHGSDPLLLSLFSTNKAQFSPLIINLFFGVFIIIGCAFILTDIIKARHGKSKL